MKQPKVVGIRLEQELIDSVKQIARATGVKSPDIMRMALTKAINEIRETGALPIPKIEA